jgi:hypothetical protein
MNNQTNQTLKDYTDQELVEQLIARMKKRKSTPDPSQFLAYLKMVLPIYLLIMEEKHCICQLKPQAKNHD